MISRRAAHWVQTVTRPGEQGVAQLGERSRIRQLELLGPARDRELRRLAGEPELTSAPAATAVAATVTACE